MKRICSLLLAAWILLISASALAAYEQYHLTEPCEFYADGYINVYPLDPHEVIVRMTPPEAPWRMELYRDGQAVRTLTAAGDYDSVAPAHPLIEEDGSFIMLCRIPGEGQDTEKFPPLNATAQWTDEGLTNITPIKEHLKAARCGNRIAFYETDEYVRISYNHKDTIIPRELADTFVIKTRSTSCIPLADEVFLIPTREDLICLDHGEIRYRLNDFPRGKELLPDGREGFFSCRWEYAEWSSDRDDSPVELVHVDGNGQQDRTYQLKGDRVIITPYQAFFDAQSGTFTLYGNAAKISGGTSAVFAMTLDADMKIINLDVRDIDPDYRDCEASVCLTSGGFPYVYLYHGDHPESVQPAVVPFSMLGNCADDYGIILQ